MYLVYTEIGPPGPSSVSLLESECPAPHAWNRVQFKHSLYSLQHPRLPAWRSQPCLAGVLLAPPASPL